MQKKWLKPSCGSTRAIWLGHGLGLMRLLKIATLNKIYDRNKHLSELEFINRLLNEFEIKFDIPEEI